MGLKVGVCVLLIVCGIIAVQGKYMSPLHDQAKHLRPEHKPLPRYEAKRAGEFFKVLILNIHFAVPGQGYKDGCIDHGFHAMVNDESSLEFLF